MKSQEQIISYVLLGAVVVGIAITVYSYVVPMIQKSYIRNLVISLEKSVSSLADVISSTGLRYGRASFEIEAPNTYLEISYNTIKIKLKTPIQYYSSFVRVPINYNEISICYNNSFPLTVGSSYNLCFADSMINLTFPNNQNMIIYDILANSSITLPIRDHKNIITSLFVFDISYNGTHVIFLPKYPVGLYKASPACIADAYQISTDVYYEIVCRPLVDLSSRICYWVIILPHYKSSATISDEIVLSISYNSYSDERYNSTVCDIVKMIDLYVSIIS